MIKLKNISIGFEKELFSSGNLSITKGSMNLLIGPNGSGKTTFFNTLLGQVKPLSGQAYINDTNLSLLQADDRSSLIGFVPSRFMGVDHLTVRELVAMGRAPYTNILNRLTTKDHEVIDEVIRELELEDIQFKSSTQISDGERQIAMIGKVLAQKTSIILLDEPTAFLDYSNRIKVLTLLKKLSVNEEKLIIFSSHDIELCMSYADHVLAIDEGKGELKEYSQPFEFDVMIRSTFK